MDTDKLSLLLSINDAIATIKDTNKLFATIFNQLHDQLDFKLGGIILLDKDKSFLEFFVGNISGNDTLDATLLLHEKIPISNVPFDLSLNDPKIIYQSLSVLQALKKQPKEKKLFDEYANNFKISSILFIPMKTAGELIGFLILSFSESTYNKEIDNIFFTKIANLIASAVSNSMAYEDLQMRKQEKEMLLRLTNTLVNIRDRDQLFISLAKEMSDLMPPGFYVTLHFNRNTVKEIINVCFVKGGDEKVKFLPTKRDKDIPLLTLKSKFLLDSNKKFHEISSEEFSQLCEQFEHFRLIRDKYKISSLLLFRYTSPNDSELFLIFGQKSIFKNFEVESLLHTVPQLALIFNNYFVFEEINLLKKQLEQEKNYLLDEISSSNSFQEIIGNSRPIQNVLNKIKQVAPLDATVLIQGETGTGKELVARAIHNLSSRNERALVKINCAALPAQLIESELFGHEKGSFTGAIEKRIGKFELANGGTIFLDEIGELPLELQSKLLRILQEKEFERVGGKSTIKTDVRVIVATNRNLEDEIVKGTFRADLFFRINVFPILVPTLSQRKEDIPLFVRHFAEKFSKSIGTSMKALKKSDLDLLINYDWPGNVRELEHIIERAVIVSEGPSLELSDFMLLKKIADTGNVESFRTIKEIEREHIITALKLANGKVTGENSASKLLGINGKTLGSKMRKLGIKREIVITT
jgi:formate hydrogenlyase transcriptional activator